MPKRSAKQLARLFITLTVLRVVTLQKAKVNSEGKIEEMMEDLAEQIAEMLQSEFETHAEDVRKALEEAQEKMNGKA